MLEYKQIFENNQRWLEEHKNSDKDFFENLSKGQDPDYLFIGCSDSRVTAEQMMNAKPGDVFIHRNIANLVPNNDPSSAAVIEYAVNHLKVKKIIVCGHYFCGGVQAAMQNTDLGILNPWLRNIRDVYRLYKDELNAITDEDKRFRRLVELNVQEQCTNVIKQASIQQSYSKNNYPQVHGWVFNVKTGQLIDLEINFLAILESIKEIYDIA
ncbi:MAG: carbonic anhydrase [Rickettsiales bacterium]|jgi:carbonic anhydrase|nr:carbonic anhydrase [Rickettsiales bacterium]